MSGADTKTKTRSVRFNEDVDCVVYTPEVSIATTPSSAVDTNVGQELVGDSFYIDEDSADLYRDGIHLELREPSVKLDLSGHVNPADIFHESILNAPATSGPILRLLISSRSLPWKIIVLPQHDYLTVRDVLITIIHSLQRPAANELLELQQSDWDLFLRVDRRRKKRLEKDKLDEHDRLARRVDWLPSKERVFFGLSSEQSLVADSSERILKVNIPLFRLF